MEAYSFFVLKRRDYLPELLQRRSEVFGSFSSVFNSAFHIPNPALK
jgi:hypothetical protein